MAAITPTSPLICLAAILLLHAATPLVSARSGLTIELIHRDSIHSPVYPGNLTRHERLQRLVQLSKSRAQRIGSMRSSDQIRPPVNEVEFLYLIHAALGTPLVPFFMVMDTGSDLIWLQCIPCIHCRPNSPLFATARSSSYFKLPCGDSLCQGYPCVNSNCYYTYSYANPATTKGVLASEIFTFASSVEGHAESVAHIGFGCGFDNQGFDIPNEIAGFIGLGGGHKSLISQLGDSVHGRFSYCLLQAVLDPNQHSFLRFGDDIALPAGAQETPFTQYFPGQLPTFYYINLTDVSIGDQRMGFAPGTFDLRRGNVGGFMLDSGTSVTHIIKPVYEELEMVMVQYFAQFNLQQIEGGRDGLLLCYVLPIDFHYFPSMTFHFEGADLVVLPENVFDIDYGVDFCWAMLPWDEGSMLGGMQQQNVRFVFDLPNRQLLFAPEDCSQDARAA